MGRHRGRTTARGEVRQYFRDNALMWLEEYHCDGLRFDATAYIRHVYGNDPRSDREHELPEGWGFLRWINEEIQARQPWKFTIAEDLKGDGWLTKDLGAGGGGFSAQWDPQFVGVVRGAIVGMADEHRDMHAVADAVAGGSGRRRLRSRHLHRVARRGRERQGARAGRDLARATPRAGTRRSGRRWARRS